VILPSHILLHHEKGRKKEMGKVVGKRTSESYTQKKRKKIHVTEITEPKE
jgi:hypothetical protein